MKKRKTFLYKYRFELIFWLVALLVVVSDQLSKYFVYVIKPNINLKILQISVTQNTGAGFGILKGQSLILAFVSLVVVLVILLYYNKIPKDKISQVLFGLFLGGVVGNLIDRLFRRYVIDFIDFGFWPSFNIADAAISISVIGMIIYFWKK